SLLNKIIKYDLAIVSNVPQTTRDQIMGVYTEDGYQFVFVDTPGIHKPLNLLGESLNKEAFSSLKDIDCVLFLSPVNEDIKSG
ncbi:GTP-binding protein, partial [Xanthomonas citri pv. citri]|nr:GTP-binding protein [Xanthomonas citri pv. citri]